MIIITCADNSGEARTGISGVMAGLASPNAPTSSANPVTKSPEARDNCPTLFTKTTARVRAHHAMNSITSYPLASGSRAATYPRRTIVAVR